MLLLLLLHCLRRIPLHYTLLLRLPSLLLLPRRMAWADLQGTPLLMSHQQI
jgi:hypothetical protein